MAKKFVPGQRLKRLPGESLNRAIEAAERVPVLEPLSGPDNKPAGADVPRCVVLVKNVTGATLLERDVVGIKRTALAMPAIGAGVATIGVLMGEAVEVEVPDAAKHTAGRWGVMLGPVAADGHGYMAIAGLVKVRIDQLDASHEFVTVKTGEKGYVESAPSGTPVTDRFLIDETGEDAEGMQWGQINLGAGGMGDSIRWGEATTAITARALDWSAPGTGTVQPKKKSGGAMVDDGATITVTNWLPIAAEAGATVEYEGSSLEVREFTCPDDEEEE
jgi:hypothetical protein